MKAKLRNKDTSENVEFLELDTEMMKEVDKAITNNFPMVYAIMEVTKSKMRLSSPKEKAQR